MDEQIASISIGTGLDISGLTRDLDRISKMTSQVKMTIGVGFDDRQVSTQINRLAQSVSRTVIRPTVDHKPFVALNKHIALKDKDIKALAQTYKKTVIAPVVDDRAFAKLDQSIDRATAKLKNLEATAKQVQAIGSIRVDASGTVGGRSSSSTSSSSRSGDDRKLAQEIGREVAKAVKSGGGVGGAVRSIASAPLRIAGNAISEAGKGITYGITQEISRNFGQGLSKAIERSLSNTVGSSELVGDKIGGAIVEAVATRTSRGFAAIPKALDKAVAGANVDRELKRKLENALTLIKDFSKKSRDSFFDTLGADSILQEGLYQRGTQQRSQSRRTPVAREQSAQEWRKSLEQHDRIQRLAANRLVKNREEMDALRSPIAEATKELRKAEASFKQINEDTPQDEVNALTRDLKVASARVAGLTKSFGQLAKYEEFINKAVKEANDSVKQSYARVNRVSPQRQDPEQYLRLARKTLGDVNEEKIPQLRVADESLKKAKAISQYNPARNTIEVTRSMYEAIQKNTLTPRQVETLKEELEHAADFDFGSFKGIRAAKQNRTVRPTANYTEEELKRFLPTLGLYRPERRELELSAKVRASRGMESYRQDQQLQRQLGDVATLSANKKVIKQQRNQFNQLIEQLQSFGSEAGNDVTKAVQVYKQVFSKAEQEVNGLIDGMLASINDIDDDEITNINEKISKLFNGDLAVIDEKLRNSIAKQIDAVAAKRRNDKPPESGSGAIVRGGGKPPTGGQTARAIQEKTIQVATEATKVMAASIRSAGQGIKAAAEVVQDALDSTPAKQFAYNMGKATRAAIEMGKFAYKITEGLESIALDMVPMGRTIKGITQQTVVPAAMFGAATHFLPGGQAAAQGLVHLAQGAASPLAEGASGALTQHAIDIIQQIIPKAFGMQQGAIGAVSTMIDSAVINATNVVAQAGAIVLGGKAIQTAATLPLKSAATPQPKTPMLMSQQQKQVEMASLPGAQETAIARTTPSSGSARSVPKDIEKREAAKQAAYKAGQVTRQVVDNVTGTAQNAIEEARKIEASFTKLYGSLKQAIKDNNSALVNIYGQGLEEFANQNKDVINNLIKQAKQAGSGAFGSEDLTVLGGIKGRLTTRQKNARRDLRKYQRTIEVTGEDISAQAIDPQIAAQARSVIQSIQQSAQASINAINKITAKLAEVEQQATLGGTLKKAAISDRGKDLIVNAGGFAASAAAQQYGPVAELSADLIGALVTRQAVELGSAGSKAVSKLQQNEAYKAAKALQKFAILLDEVNKQLQSREFGDIQSSALFGDLTGFIIGNLVKELPNLASGVVGMDALGSVPGRGAMVAMQSVPQLQKLRDKILQQLAESVDVDEASGEDIKAQMLNFSYKGLNPDSRKNRFLNPAEKAFLEDVLKTLNDAIDAADRFDARINKALKNAQKEYEASAEAVEKLVNPDFEELNQKVEQRIKELDALVNELDQTYRQRSKQALDDLEEQEQYRQAYAEGMGIDPDSIEAMTLPPMPKGDSAITQFFKALKGDADDLMKSIGGISGMAKKAIGGLLGFIALNTLLPVLQSFAASSVEAAREFERFERTLGFITGSADKAQSVLAGLRAESKALGIDLRGAIAGQTQLMAATRGTALEGAATEQIGAATRQAASVYGLTPEQFDRMNIAISQMASKGKVSAEELRCFSTGTEVLTDKGWMRWEDVDETCLFISRNLKTGEVEYQKPKRLIRFHHKGKMFKVKNDRVDLLVTPEHRMVVREEGETEYKIVEARDLEDKPYYYLVNIDGTEEAIVYPEETEWVDYDDEAFCAEVPFTTLFVRRNGKELVSGNSQLGEVLPGAFTIFARSIGVSTAQLDKMLERGEVGTDAIVKFAQQLQSETSTGVAGAANSAQASLNRFNTSVYELQVAFGKTLLPAQSLGLNALTKALEVLQDLIPTITTAVTILGARLALSLGASALKAVGATTSLQGALMALPGALRGIYAAIAPLAAQFLAFALIGDMFNSIRQEMSDSAEASREFADSATEGLQKYLEVTGQATDQTKELAKALESLPQSRAESSFVTGGVYKGLMGEEGGTSYLRELEQYQASGGTQMTFDLYRMFGKTPPMRGDDIAKVGPTQPLSEKRAQDIIAATQEGLNSTDALFDRSQSMLDRYQQGGGDLRRIRELDIRARDLQGQRSLLPAADTEGRRKIDAEYNKILEDRNKLAEGFTTLQSELSTRVEAMKKTREELEDTLSKGGLSKESRAELEKQLSQVNAELERGLKLQDAQNKAINTAIESAAKLQIQFEAIVASLDILNTQSQTLNSQTLTGISQAQLSGSMTPGQAQAALADAEQANLARTIENLNTGITKLNDLIGSTANSRALAFAGLTPDVDALTLSEKIADLRKQGVNEDSEEFKTLTGLQQQLNQRDQLKMQVAQSQQQQAQVAAQTAESIRDANKQVVEFYRNVQRQTEDLQIVLEQQQFETKMQNLRNDLNRSLSGFSDVFFGDMWSSLNELFDFATERSRLMTENAQREAEIQRQAIDTTRQGNEQIRTTYGGSTVPFQGVQVTSAVDASGEPGLDYVVSDGQRGAQFGALSPGEVIEVRRDDRELGTGGERGYGNTVIVRTVDQVSGEIVDMLYAHLDDIMVQVGQQVGVGSVLGTQGRTGSTTGAHVSVDFFGKDSASATSASLSMRDRIAATLVNNPDSLNQLIQSPIGQAVGGGLQAPQASSSAPTSAVQLAPEEFYRLAALSTLEAATPQGRADVAQSVFNRLNSGSYGSTITDVLYAPGQYQPFFGASPSEITDAESAAQFLSKERGYGLEEARSIIQETTAILSDTSAMMDAAEHVGGRTDFKGVSQYGNMVPSEDRLRQQGENFFHISSSQTQSDLDRYRSMAPSAVVTAGVSATGGGSVNTAPITAATSQAQVNAQAAIASADAQLQSNLDRLAIQEEQAKRRADRQRQEGLDRIAQQNTELRRQQDETILGAFGDSEAAGVLRELRANNNQLTDATLAQQRQLRDLSDTIANTETYIDFYEQNPTAPGADQLPKLQEALTQVQSEYDTLKALVERQTSVSSQERTRILEQRQQQLLERSRASDLETLGLQNQLSIARTPEGLGRELLRSSQATNDILREYTTRSNELRKKAEELQATLDETIASGVEYSADELEAVKQEIQANLNEAVALDNQATLKVEIELENRQQVIDQFAEDLGSRARDAQVQYLQNRGDTFGANEVQRRYAMDQQAIQYQQDASQLDAMALESGADLGQISQMRSDLEALNQFNLDNLRMQFPDLADSINSTAFQAFQNLGTSIADVFANAKSGEDILKGLGQAFQQFASQIISSLLNMAAQAAASELFGLFFPQKGGASGGGLGSLFGTLAGGVSSLGGASFGSTDIPTGGFNLGGATGGGGGGFNWGSLVSTGLSLIGGFDKGGLIPGTYTGTPDQHIARVNPGEYVLNRESVQRIGVTKLDALNNIKGFNRLPRFNDGGYRDYASSPSRSYRDYSAESDGRSSSNESSGGPIEVKLDTEVVNNIEYARKEEVEEAMKRAAEEGAKKGEERVRRGISKNPSYRQGMGIR